MATVAQRTPTNVPDATQSTPSPTSIPGRCSRPGRDFRLAERFLFRSRKNSGRQTARDGMSIRRRSRLRKTVVGQIWWLIARSRRPPTSPAVRRASTADHQAATVGDRRSALARRRCVPPPLPPRRTRRVADWIRQRAARSRRQATTLVRSRPPSQPLHPLPLALRQSSSTRG